MHYYYYYGCACSLDPSISLSLQAQHNLSIMAAHSTCPLGKANYRRLWLISACAYSGKRNDSMRLIKDMRLYGT